jgi:predicted nucleic acid-binding Zn ribbon protein
MEPLQRAIPDVLTHLLRNAPLSDEKLVFAWRNAVGPAMARASTVRLSGDGTVEVVCADDRWRREIRRSLPVIKERLSALLGHDIVSRVKVAGAARGKRGT